MSANVERQLRTAQAAFDEYVDKLADEKRQRTYRLARLLNDYLRKWYEHQKRLRESGQDPAVGGEAKRELADHVRRQLGRTNTAILCAGQPSLLMTQLNEKHRGGSFLLMPQKSKRPLLTRSDLADLMRDSQEGGRRDRPGFTLVEPALRREELPDWRNRVRPKGVGQERTGRGG